jgi:hypothetical protein
MIAGGNAAFIYGLGTKIKKELNPGYSEIRIFTWRCQKSINIVQNSLKMDRNSRLLSYIEVYQTPSSCHQLLHQFKWKNGFRCRRCGCTETIKARAEYHMRCKNCKYDESSTAHTMFHKLKFPITKAFAIVFQVATMKKGMSACEISRQHTINKETAWFFRRKIQTAMMAEFANQDRFKENCNDLFEFIRDSGKSFNKKSLKSEKESIRHRKASKLPIEKKPNATVSMAPCRRSKRIKFASLKFKMLRAEKRGQRLLHFVNLMDTRIDSIWKEFRIYNLKSWLIGIHHRVSLEHIRHYFTEFIYRLKNRMIIQSLPMKILQRFVYHGRMPYLALIAA